MNVGHMGLTLRDAALMTMQDYVDACAWAADEYAGPALRRATQADIDALWG